MRVCLYCQVAKLRQQRSETYLSTERISLVSSMAASLFTGRVVDIDWWVLLLCMSTTTTITTTTISSITATTDIADITTYYITTTLLLLLLLLLQG